MAIMNMSLRDAADAYRNRSQRAEPSAEPLRGNVRPESDVTSLIRSRPVVRSPIATPPAVATPHPSDRWKTSDEWKMLAECGPNDTELFFSKDPVEKRAALAICGDCPVAKECLAEAMSQERGVDLHGRYGIRGGTTPVERRELARARKDGPVKPR
jgi:hypothetical protein